MSDDDTRNRIIALEKSIKSLNKTIEAMNLSHNIFRKIMGFIRKHQKYIRLMIDILVVLGAILSFFKV